MPSKKPSTSYVLQPNHLQLGKLFQGMESLIVYIRKISGDVDFQDEISAFRILHQSLDVFGAERIDSACRTNPVERRSQKCLAASLAKHGNQDYQKNYDGEKASRRYEGAAQPAKRLMSRCIIHTRSAIIARG
jgi:hypothetical protein